MMTDKLVPPLSGLIRMLARSRPALQELASIRSLLDDTAADCAAALRAIAGAEFMITVRHIDTVSLSKTMAGKIGSICSLFLIPEWNAQAVFSCSTRLLSQLLDAMYGGENGRSADAEERSLTLLERNIAGTISLAIFDQLRNRLNTYLEFSLRLVGVDELRDAEPYGKNETDYMVIHLAVGATDEQIMLAIPLKGLELIRDPLETVSAQVTHDPDPNWRGQFQKSVADVPVELIATCAGPALMLAEVAKFKIGYLIEFEEANLKAVTIESAGETIFGGRLGQSNGCFTVCLEAPLHCGGA